MILVALAVLVSSPPSPTFAEEDVSHCTVEVLLSSVVAVRSHDGTHRGDATPGEYYVRARNGRELGPFELRTGEQSSFSPGLLLDVIDSRWPLPADDERAVMLMPFELAVREDDSSLPGEDDVDDLSEPLVVREHLVCPGGQATVTRIIDVIQRTSDGSAGKPDRLKLGIQIRSTDR